MLQPNMTDGQVEEFWWKNENYSQYFIKKLLEPGMHFDKLIFPQEDDTFWNRKALFYMKIHTVLQKGLGKH